MLFPQLRPEPVGAVLCQARQVGAGRLGNATAGHTCAARAQTGRQVGGNPDTLPTYSTQQCLCTPSTHSTPGLSQPPYLSGNRALPGVMCAQRAAAVRSMRALAEIHANLRR